MPPVCSLHQQQTSASADKQCCILTPCSSILLIHRALPLRKPGLQALAAHALSHQAMSGCRQWAQEPRWVQRNRTPTARGVQPGGTPRSWSSKCRPAQAQVRLVRPPPCCVCCWTCIAGFASGGQPHQGDVGQRSAWPRMQCLCLSVCQHLPQLSHLQHQAPVCRDILPGRQRTASFLPVKPGEVLRTLHCIDAEGPCLPGFHLEHMLGTCRALTRACPEQLHRASASRAVPVTLVCAAAAPVKWRRSRERRAAWSRTASCRCALFRLTRRAKASCQRAH